MWIHALSFSSSSLPFSISQAAESWKAQAVPGAEGCVVLWDPAWVVLQQDKKALSVNYENQRSYNCHSCSSARGPAIIECFFPTSPWQAIDCFRALQHGLRHSPELVFPATQAPIYTRSCFSVKGFHSHPFIVIPVCCTASVSYFSLARECKCIPRSGHELVTPETDIWNWICLTCSSDIYGWSSLPRLTLWAAERNRNSWDSVHLLLR